MNIKTHSYFSKNSWNNFIFTQPEASFYHLYKWTKIAEKTLGFKQKLLVCYEKKEVAGVLPLFFKNGFLGSRLVTLPVGDWTGPIGEQKAISALIERAKQLADQTPSSLEIFSISKLPKLLKGISQTGRHACYVLSPTKKHEKVFTEKMHKKTRNMVRKAKKNGIKAILADKKDLKKFYKLYLETMRKIGTIPLPFKVFQAVWENFSKETKLLKAVYKKEAIGYLWTFVWNKTLWIWANASCEKYLALGVNYALYNTAIKIACEKKGINKVNFGSSEHQSAHEFFKLRWGTQKKTIYLISNSKKTQKRWFLQAKLKPFFKKIPLWMLELAGNLAYKI